jgi:transcriptional regulator with XRE-family HTH domain
LTGSVSLANTNVVQAPGRKKFKAFLKDNGIAKRRAARDLKVSAPTILDWESGTKTPTPENREAIRVYTRGEVTEQDWETPRDRKAEKRVATVKPFEPDAPAEEPPASERKPNGNHGSAA